MEEVSPGPRDMLSFRFIFYWDILLLVNSHMTKKRFWTKKLKNFVKLLIDICASEINLMLLLI